MMENVPDFCFKGGKVVVTCGPGYEKVDEVRRLTNHSTGKLGTELSRALVKAGFEVVCLKGVLSTWTETVPGLEARSFSTSESLLDELEALGTSGEVGAVFHAAALSDFKVKQICDIEGRPLKGKKISSRQGEVQMILQPAPKIIDSLRKFFPRAFLAGWKYELDGSPDDVLQAGLRQISDNRTDACVLNGAAYGEGFGFCEKAGPLHHCESAEMLFTFLVERLHGAKG